MAFGISLDNQIHFELGDRGGETREDFLLGRIRALRTGTLSAVAVWQMPDGLMFEKAFASTAPHFYVQAAGRDDRLTVEWRRSEPGGPRHYVVGQPGVTADHSGQPPETVRWAEHSTQVYPHEVFTPDQAFAVFKEYLDTGSLSTDWSLRLLTL